MCHSGGRCWWEGGLCMCGGGGYMETLSAQFWCEPDAALKNKDCLKGGWGEASCKQNKTPPLRSLKMYHKLTFYIYLYVYLYLNIWKKIKPITKIIPEEISSTGGMVKGQSALSLMFHRFLLNDGNVCSAACVIKMEMFFSL